MKIREVIELLQLEPDLEKELQVQTVDGRYEITGTSNNHQGLEFSKVMLDTTKIQDLRGDQC